MARPREFEIEKAVEQAMNVFWQHGYEGASLSDLLDGMGLTRGSLYKAFTDKKTLFIKVLSFYDQIAVSAAVDLLTDKSIPNGWMRVLALFDTIAEAAARGDRRGCLLCSTAAGPAAYDADIANAVKKSIDEMRNAFQDAIDDSPGGQKRVSCLKEDLPDFLVTQYVGLRILARSELHTSFIQQSVNAIRNFEPNQQI